MAQLKNGVVGTLLVVLTSTAGSSAQAPQPPSRNPYVEVFQGLLNDWDQKKLRFPAKVALTDEFEGRLVERVRARPLGYETDTWKNQTFSKWGSLPSDFGPQLPLSEGAKLAILAGYVDNISMFKFPPTPEAVWRESRIGLYAVLSLSQAKALGKKQAAINSRDVQESIVSMMTSIYPICALSP